MDKRLERIEQKMDVMFETMHSHHAAMLKQSQRSEGRLSKLETVQKGTITVFGTAITAAFTYIVHLFTKGS
jgi:hypothetical protein